MRTRSAWWVLVATAVVIQAACGADGGTDPTPPPKPVASVIVTPASLALAPGETGSLTADLRAADGTALAGRPVTWTTSDPAVATVSTQGAVSALTIGSATVTATAEGRSGSAQVVVAHPPATTVAVLPATLSIQPAQTGQFTAEARNPAGNAIPGKTFTWAVGNPLVATISQTGQVSGLIPGTTTVTASVDGKIGSATLTVVPGAVATVEVAPAASTVEVTRTVQFVATAKDASGFVVPGQMVTWVSSAPSIFSVSNSGLVTGVAPGGPVTVWAVVGEQAGAASITVVPGPAVSVTVTPGASTLQVGQMVQLAVAAKDAQGNAIVGRPVTWTSAALATVSVSTAGLVTALAAGGPVTITATIDGVPGSAAITVVPVPVATVEVTPPSATILVNGTVQLTATAKAADGSVLAGRVVQWVSNNPAIATVTPTGGLVTGVSAGTVTITATSEGRSGTAAVTVTLTYVPGGTLSDGDFVLVQTGSFQMGSTNGTSYELPVHTVAITRPFYLQRTELTQAQWRAVMGSNPSYDVACGDRCPVDRVSWFVIDTLIQRLNQAQPGKNYRLPTEAEWEYAARAGTTGDYGGTGVLDQMGWYSGNSGNQLHPVAQKAANAWGLHDMHGNVSEWVQDRWGASYYSVSPANDPPGPATGSYRVLRDGSAGSGALQTRSAYRAFLYPGDRSIRIGFRLARTP